MKGVEYRLQDFLKPAGGSARLGRLLGGSASDLASSGWGGLQSRAN